MACYKDLIKQIREKKVEQEDIDSLMEWAFSALEKADTRMHHEIMEKMEHYAYSFSKEEAEKVVHSMRPRSQYWTYEQIKDYVATKGVTEHCVEWYMVMNMVYNDYYNTAKAYGLQDDVEFYFNLARDFIEDPDAGPYKVAKYFTE